MSSNKAIEDKFDGLIKSLVSALQRSDDSLVSQAKDLMQQVKDENSSLTREQAESAVRKIFVRATVDVVPEFKLDMDAWIKVFEKSHTRTEKEDYATMFPNIFAQDQRVEGDLSTWLYELRAQWSKRVNWFCKIVSSVFE